MNYKMMGRFIYQILFIEGLFMIPALCISLYHGDDMAIRGFLWSLALILILGTALFALCRKAPSAFYAKEGLVCVGISWIVLSLLGCLPFVFSGNIPRFVDARSVSPRKIMIRNGVSVLGEGLVQTRTDLCRPVEMPEDVQLLEMAKVYRLSKWCTFRRIWVPSVMPFFRMACSSALGLGWKAGIAAEVLTSAKNSIGKEIFEAKQYMETVNLFAWTLVVIVLSLLIEKLVLALLDRLIEGFYGVLIAAHVVLKNLALHSVGIKQHRNIPCRHVGVGKINGRLAGENKRVVHVAPL